MNDKCPRCGIKVVFAKKESLTECYNCKSKLLVATINSKKELHDVTPKEDLKK